MCEVLRRSAVANDMTAATILMRLPMQRAAALRFLSRTKAIIAAQSDPETCQTGETGQHEGSGTQRLRRTQARWYFPTLSGQDKAIIPGTRIDEHSASACLACIVGANLKTQQNPRLASCCTATVVWQLVDPMTPMMS
jgi:hypothetical protein